jgi:hypothetical protein
MEVSLSTRDEFTATLDLHTSARHRPTDRYLIGLGLPGMSQLAPGCSASVGLAFSTLGLASFSSAISSAW